MITVGTETLSIPVLEELEPYMEQFDKAVVRDDKLQSCSPFRHDQHPSFAVHLENGSWIDSGATDDHRKGHFIQLLAFLRQEEAEDTVDYLINKYSIRKLDADVLRVDMSWLHPKPKPKIFFTEDLQQYAYRHPYLSNRGISEDVQRLFRVGYCKDSQAVVMPWADINSQVINLKYRAVNSKRFWYHKEGQRVKYHCYGLDKVQEKQCKTVWLVESEIDCLRLWTLDIPAIAFGTANISKQQESLLRNSTAETLVIAVDNDRVGREFKQKLTSLFLGAKELKEVLFPSDNIKDISDMTDDQIKYSAQNLQDITVKLQLDMQ